jgi:hypothetical protein
MTLGQIEARESLDARTCLRRTNRTAPAFIGGLSSVARTFSRHGGVTSVRAPSSLSRSSLALRSRLGTLASTQSSASRPEMKENTMEAAQETGNLIASEKVEGTNVYNAAGDNLGAIHDLMIDKDRKSRLSRLEPPLRRRLTERRAIVICSGSSAGFNDRRAKSGLRSSMTLHAAPNTVSLKMTSRSLPEIPSLLTHS